MRVLFKKGEQRKFLQKVLKNLACPTLNELRNRGFEINYSTLKNYFNESRTLPKELFLELCEISKIEPEALFLKENWGQVKGGKRVRENNFQNI